MRRAAHAFSVSALMGAPSLELQNQAVQSRRQALHSATVMHPFTRTARREFLKFLAASPYVAALGGVSAFVEQCVFAQTNPQNPDVVTDPSKALDVFDFEEVAHRKVSQAHWAYMASGV